MLSIEKSAYSLSIDVQENGASFAGGMFGGLALAEAPVFELLLESLTGREPLKLTSLTGWKRVRARRYGDTIRLHFQIRILRTALLPGGADIPQNKYGSWNSSHLQDQIICFPMAIPHR